jgi:hypothetical protein
MPAGRSPHATAYRRFTIAAVTHEEQARAISRMWECAGGDPEATRQIALVLFGPLNPAIPPHEGAKQRLRRAQARQ